MNGSLINHLLPTASKLPAVGDGVTLCFWSDRRPATVLFVSERRIVVQEDNAVRTDTRGETDSGQEYKFSPDPNGTITIFTKRKNGKFHQQGQKIGSCPKLVLGGRDRYHDPHQ